MFVHVEKGRSVSGFCASFFQNGLNTKKETGEYRKEEDQDQER